MIYGIFHIKVILGSLGLFLQLQQLSKETPRAEAPAAKARRRRMV